MPFRNLWKVSEMTLYEMLDCTKYYQKVWIYEHNAYDQNMPIFKGTVEDARGDTEHTWMYLMCQVDHYDCTTGTLVIMVKDEYYEKRLEEHYGFSSRWGKERSERPWLYSLEVYDDLGEEGKRK